MPSALSRQLLLFLLIGGTQVALDWAVFVATTHAGAPLAVGNFIGRLSGASLGFWLNGRYTFAQAGQARLEARHLRRFVIAWLLLTALSTLLLGAIQLQFELRAAWLAKPLVEALLAMLGFVVWRQWVYR